MNRIFAVGLVAGVGLGCRTDVDDAGPVFLALASEPNAHMDALFDGPVVLDQAGCIRLGATGPTAVWPYRSRLVPDGTGWTVIDRDGGVIARIGDPARLGGGEVPAGSPLVAPSLSDRALARCPGRYWVVAGR